MLVFPLKFWLTGTCSGKAGDFRWSCRPVSQLLNICEVLMLRMYKTTIHSFILYFWLKFFQLSSKCLTKYSHHFLNDGCGLKVTTIYYEEAYSRQNFDWGTADKSNTWRIMRPFTLSEARHGIRVFPAAVPNPTMAWMLHRNKYLTWSYCSCCWLSLDISLIFTHLLKHIT